jgi:hypothetical protein
MEGFEGLWFECESGDEGETRKEQVEKVYFIVAEHAYIIYGQLRPSKCQRFSCLCALLIAVK